MQDPRRDQRADEVGSKFALQPSAHRRQQITGDGGGAARAALAQLLAEQPQCAERARLLAEQTEDQIGIVLDLAHRASVGSAIAWVDRVEGSNVFGARLAEHQHAIVGQDDSGRDERGQKAEPRGSERLAQQRIMGGGDEQRVAHREQVMPPAGLGHFAGADATAGNQLAFEYDHLATAQRQLGATDQRIDPAADDEDVEGVHGSVSRMRCSAQLCVAVHR